MCDSFSCASHGFLSNNGMSGGGGGEIRGRGSIERKMASRRGASSSPWHGPPPSDNVQLLQAKVLVAFFLAVCFSRMRRYEEEGLGAEGQRGALLPTTTTTARGQNPLIRRKEEAGTRERERESNLPSNAQLSPPLLLFQVRTCEQISRPQHLAG